MIQQVQNSFQFHGLPGDDANKHLDKFLHVTQSIKVNEVTDDSLRLYLFPHSLTHHATAWFDRSPRNSINIFEQMAKMFLEKYFPPSMVTKLRNEITNFRQHPDESLFKAWERYKLLIDCCPNHNMLPAIVSETQNVYATGAYNQGGNSYQPQDNCNFLSYHSNNYLGLPGFNQNQNQNNPNQNYQNQNKNQGNNHGIPRWNNQGRNQLFQGASHGQNPPPAYQASGYHAPVQQASIHQPNTISNPKEDLKGITTRSRNAYKGPTIPTTSSLPQVVERKTEVTKDTVHPTNNRSTKDVQPPIVKIENQIPNSEPVVALVVEPVEAPVSALKPNQKPLIPYPSRLHDQKLHDKTNDQKEKFFKIFQDLDFNISFADALILRPKFGPTIKSLLTNKDKLFELARTLLNKHCSAVLLKKLPEKLGDPDKFLIPCDFLGMDECLALANLGASINLMPLSVWNKLSLPELSPTSCEEYSQEVLGFFVSGNPTPSMKPIVSTSSPTLTPFEDSDFLLEETDAFLAIDDEPISSEIDDCYYDSEGDILLLEEFLNDDPSSPPLPP
uniref:Reverse transcriptase domain-containing protein n=1 Tax=Tanacetum cinerariifolium TaxID=118510 RepID=A0A6L2LZK6_TANCI|nr:reverse transcriptase domain-containing protein [Tanacetum cinerariifolium]